MDVSLIAICGIVFGWAVVAIGIRAKTEEQVARLRHDLYVKMLESGKVTKEEMEEMLHGVGQGTRPGPRESAARASSCGFFRFLVAVGWLGLLTALGLFVASRFAADSIRSNMAIASAIVGAVALGLIGLPIALRELAGPRGGPAGSAP